MVDATVSNTVGHNARAGSTPALGTSFDSNRNQKRPLRTPEGSFRVQGSSDQHAPSVPVIRHLSQHHELTPVR